MQAYQREESVVSDTDLTTILLQIHPQVRTQKIVLVGHSQGTYYTNDLYKYLTKHGVSGNAIAVYNVATPASYVAGGGRYLTSATDKVINRVREALKHAPSVESFGAGAVLATVPQTYPDDSLPANTSFVLSPEEEANKNGGHSFSNVYLENAPATIVSAISGDISGLSATADVAGDCFAAPSSGVLYQAKKAGLSTFDFVTAHARPVLAFAWDFVVDVGTKVPSNLASVAGSLVDAITPTPRTTNLAGSHDIVGAIYGSSVTEENLREFGLLEDQGGAVALAVENRGEVKGVETEKPIEPPPGGFAVPSPGFGGGGGSSATVAVAVEEAPAEDTPAPADAPPDPLPPLEPVLPEPVVSDGVRPSIATVTINGAALPQMSPFATSPVATTTTTWSTIVTFDEDISIPPGVKDGTASFEFTNGTEQAVGDCGDGDAKTFCFTYIPPPNIEAAVFWFFQIAGAQDMSGEMLASTTYRFIVDTAGPLLTLDTPAVNQTFPTISGTSSFTQASIVLSLNNTVYALSSPNGLWSFAVQPEAELVEGSYPIVATSTDQYHNTVAYNWTLVVDLTAPAPAITSGPAEGASVASTSAITFEFSAADATAVSYTCAVDGGGASVCSSPYSFSPAPGSRSFAITATDAAGNATSTTRNLTVLP